MNIKEKVIKIGKFISKNSHWFLTGIGVSAITVGAIDLAKTVQSPKFRALMASSRYAITDIKRDENGKATTKDIIKGYAKSAGKVMQAYARPVALIAGGTSCIVAAVFVQSNRVKQLVTLYTTTVAAYEAYRARVRAVVGEDKEFDLYNDIERNEEGKVVTINGQKATELKGFKGTEQVTKFSRLIGDGRCGLWDKNGRVMYHMLRNAEEQVREMLIQRAQEARDNIGVVYLNEIYDIFELPKSEEGMKYSYAYDPSNPDTNPNFRIVENQLGEQGIDDLVHAWNQELWLDFPVNYYVDHPYKPESIHSIDEKQKILENRKKINKKNVDSDGDSYETFDVYNEETKETTTYVKGYDKMISHDILNEIAEETGDYYK